MTDKPAATGEIWTIAGNDAIEEGVSRETVLRIEEASASRTRNVVLSEIERRLYGEANPVDVEEWQIDRLRRIVSQMREER